jgi:23S rRNA (guanosine2251-2'-O)-methyltransferase
MEVLYGIHSVSEALRSRAQRIDYVAIARERHDAKLQRIIDDCRASGISVRFMPRPHLDRTARTANHQGVIAVTAAKEYADLEALMARKRGRHSLIVVLDGVQDPQNLGAIIRTSEGAGADGIVIPERRAAGVTGTVAKASAGASEYLPIARVTNISRTLEQLKSANIWTVGLEERATQPYDQLDYKMDCAIVLGAEGTGLHDLVRKKCDFLVSLPMVGKVPSLNVSVAAGVMLYEVLRQRNANSPRRRGDAEEPGH